MNSMSGPSPPKRQKVDSGAMTTMLGEGAARRIIDEFCMSDREERLSNWQSSCNKIIDCFRAYPKLLLDTFLENKRTFLAVRCFPLDIIIRCGAGLDVIKELQEVCPQPVQELMSNTKRFTGLFDGFTMNHAENWNSCVTAEVLEYLVQQYPDIASQKMHYEHETPECLLLELLVRMNNRIFVTARVIQTVLKANPDAVVQAELKADLLGILIEQRCRKPDIMDAIVNAIIANSHQIDTISLCTGGTRRALRPSCDAKIIPKLFPHLKKITIPLSFSRAPDNGTMEILRAFSNCHNSSIKQLVLEMPSRALSSESETNGLGNMLRQLLCSKAAAFLEKLMLKSRHLPSNYDDYPMDNWMVLLFQECESLPTSLKHLEFSNIELDETLDFSAWLRTPNLPATVAFSCLKIKGVFTMPAVVDPATRLPPAPGGPTVKHLEFFAEGDRDCVRDILTYHVGSAIHLQSLSLGFSQAVDVTDAVRSLMRSNQFRTLELHANTLLDLPAFCEMLRGNQGLLKFHKLQYPKAVILSKLHDILKHDNQTLTQITMMTSPTQMEPLDYYLTLNRFGRREAHDPAIPLERLVDVLCNVAENDDKVTLDCLQRVNTYYGLLRDSIIGTWSVAAL